MGKLHKYGSVFLSFCLLAGISACGEEGTETMGSKKVDIYEIGPNQMPMLFWHIQEENYTAAQALLDAGADINQRGGHAMTPAIWAATSDDWKGVKFLIERGADLSLYGTNGFTVADLAKTSRVLLDAPSGPYLQYVRDILKERGLYDNVPTAAELKAQMQAGKIPTPQTFDRKKWPPKK